MATLEQDLTQAAEKYWDKHHRPRWNGTTNGVSVPVFHGKKPDMMLGSELDDPFTKCIVVEIKPTKEGVIKDLTKKAVYHTCKHLAGIYFVGSMSCGARFKFLNGKIEQISIATRAIFDVGIDSDFVGSYFLVVKAKFTNADGYRAVLIGK